MNRSSTSPFRGVGSRTGGSQSLQTIIRSLEQENNSLVEQIGILKAKNKKVIELQDKTDMILRHNTQLLNENERLAKLINQKKSQIDIWKNKHDSLLANRSTASDLEVKRLLNEIEKLKEESGEIEHAKNLQINQIKNQHHLELQNLKRNNLGNAEKYQLEIRKLKQYCDKKDYEVSDLKMKIARMSKETDFEIAKLREQKQRLRSDLQFQQSQHRKEVEGLKNKFDFNFASEIENLKKQHLNQIQTLDYENSKLKQVINSKNVELEQSILKQNKMRNHFEDSLELLKKENTELKEKLVENEHISDLQLANLRDKLDSIKESELSLLREASNNQADILNRQISKLRKFLDSRNQQIQIIAKERNQLKQALEAEVLKAKAIVQAREAQIKQLNAKHEQALRICDQDFKYKNQQMKASENLLNTQIETLKKENRTLQELLQRKQKQLQSETSTSSQDIAGLKSEVSSLRQQLQTAKDDNERTSRRSSSELDDLRKMSELKAKQFETRITGLEEEVKQRDALIAQLKDNISLLQKQIKLSDQKISYLQNSQTQLRTQARDNFSKWDAKQKQLNKLIREQIQTMQRTKSNEINQLKAIHDNKISTHRHQIRELQRNLEDKNRLINDLKSKYEELVNNFEKVFAQEAARKNLDIKVPGWLPETLALKSTFDVFIKNKVLQYCS